FSCQFSVGISFIEIPRSYVSEVIYNKMYDITSFTNRRNTGYLAELFFGKPTDEDTDGFPAKPKRKPVIKRFEESSDDNDTDKAEAELIEQVRRQIAKEQPLIDELEANTTEHPFEDDDSDEEPERKKLATYGREAIFPIPSRFILQKAAWSRHSSYWLNMA
ncbi:MAG: hypothetical protein ACI4D2_06910, partial [Lachnospiraceae bacterium]